MSATNDANRPRTVFATATRQRGPYRIEDWGKTWTNPDKARVLARVPAIALPDIAGYWAHTTRPVRGPQEYWRCLHRALVACLRAFGGPPRTTTPTKS
jgi:hypothetical protein